MITKTHKGKYYNIDYSIVNTSELEGELRIDAEYYEPYWINLEKKIESLNYKFLYTLASNKYKTFNHKTYKNLYYLEIANIDLFTGAYKAKKITTLEAPSSAKKMVEEKDILISTVRPNRNAVAFVFEIKEKPLVASVGFCKLKVISDLILPEYLFSLFKTKYYRDILVRKTTGTMYPVVSEEDIKKLKIPIPSNNFQKLIEKLVLKAYEDIRKSENLYKEAENILLEELDLKNWKSKSKKIKIDNIELEEEENISIRVLSEVVKVDRMDSEYWEPKYDEIEKLIKNYKNGYDYLPNLITISKEKIKANKGKTYYYIELADINPNLGVVDQTKAIKGEDLPSRARMKIKKGDIIMSSLKGSIDKIALIDFNKANLVASTGFFVFREKKINKETLLILLKILANIYLVREAQGTILTAIPYDSLIRVIIPKVDKQIQQKISQLIQQSFKARENAKELLEIAKRSVEIYIEEDENEGINYAKNKIKELGVEI